MSCRAVVVTSSALTGVLGVGPAGLEPAING